MHTGGATGAIGRAWKVRRFFSFFFFFFFVVVFGKERG